MKKPISDPTLAREIGYGMKKFRKKLYNEGRKSFTQQGCADKIGVKQQQWAAWESGKSNPPNPANQRRIAELLEVSLAELRGEAGMAAAGAGTSPGAAVQSLDVIFTLQGSLSKVLDSLSVVGKYVSAGGALREYEDIPGLVRAIRLASELGQGLADSLEGRQEHSASRDQSSA